MARGIDEGTARRLVVRGFFADIIERIGIPDIEERLMAAVDDELSSHEIARSAHDSARGQND
jgi:Fe-S cluster assembly protein SufD